MDQFVVPIEIEMEGVTETPPNPTQNITENTTQKTIPNTTPKKKKPVKLKSPKKEGDEPLTNNKKPTRTSDVWEHFTKVKGGDPNNPRCNCNYCGADYACHSTRVGTSSLWVHFRKCKKRVDKKQKVLSFKKETGGGSNLLAVTFNKVRCRTALAKFVVKDEQAFRVVEGDGFKELLQELQPKFVVPSRVTLARDVHHLFCNERAKLMNELTTTHQRTFGRYEDEDDKFLSYFNEKENGKKRIGPPMYSDWQAAVVFVKFLATFYEVTLKFSSTLNVTSNNFYHEICEVQGVVLDPRYKMRYLKYCFENVYDAESVARIVVKVEALLQRLYTSYDSQADNVGPKVDGITVSPKTAGTGSAPNKRRLLENYMHQHQMEISEQKNDLDRYLNEEPLNPMNSSFDILMWWKDNSERSSLSPKMVEVLVCTQSWLKGDKGGLKLNDFIDETYSYQFVEEENVNKMKDQTTSEKTATKDINIIDV
ncbi:hypothetical protein POM88_035907 [Heracleum sosnowskyi]|uniref:BED-type domain-containing protein n=1 Tax=Heracleum sosnowskyi TaxID=360622 RepID=A0AAD8HM69_9APIA|nr:hypothetical protein POM88_035907 [Heracleum sosnowskyi]